VRSLFRNPKLSSLSLSPSLTLSLSFSLHSALYACFHRFSRTPPDATLAHDVYVFLTNPESFVMLFSYLSFVWMFRLLPAAYYDYDAPLQWWHVAAQFLVVDVLTTASHLLEHNWAALYIRSHKMHHRFTNPKLYNAFSGSLLDTFSLILVPLFLTHQICFFVNNMGLAAFGTLYAAQFTMIHCEYRHPWDTLFEWLGIGTAEDHNIHHLLFKYNYGHFFMWWDWLLGTYKAPHTVKQFRSFVELAAAHPELQQQLQKEAESEANTD
jgi:sterol desaturase/sphingolipid hydroxylase (fatty acid hydroxylase superfamily)